MTLAPPRRPEEPRRPAVASKTLAHAAVLTIAVTLAGSLLGLVRDLLLARYFGANGATDAFLVAWTVPETAFPLVVEGALAFLLVPLFSRALAAADPGAVDPGAVDPAAAVRDLVTASAPRILGVLVVASATVAAGAPILVHLIAPGLADPALAVTCTRLTAVTVLTFGLAGYLSAALRAHHVFGAPATIHLAYNTGILGLVLLLHNRFGIVSAAAGVALGSVFMVLAQVPSFVRHVGLPRRLVLRGSPVTLAAFAPIAAYTLTRQAQVFVERHVGSALPEGTISHLNYAQKVAQMPMLVALLVCTVTFPTLARTVAAGQAAKARLRLESDLRTVTSLIVVSAAYLLAFAPTVVGILLQHGRFTAQDTAATATIVRVYALGLLGQALVGVLCRPFFTAARPGWYPAAVMALGLTVTTALAVLGAPAFGVVAIAAANALGISVTAVLLLAGLRRCAVAVSLSAVGSATARLAVAGAGAAAAGWLAGGLLSGAPSIVDGTVGGLVVLGTFAVLAHLTGGLRRAR